MGGVSGRCEVGSGGGRGGGALLMFIYTSWFYGEGQNQRVGLSGLGLTGIVSFEFAG